MSIKVLDNLTINKIAAGEVVENATSVIKELVENSIDAEAKNILIEVRNAGIDYLKVTDDGVGIKKDEIKVAFKEHATSKLNSIEDLDSIESFGFRGEALPSILAVSDVALTTKSKDEPENFGYRYSVINQSEENFEEVPANFGTSIMVSNLFKNVPARKKFLKDASRENSYIYDMVIKFALANPYISFKLIIDGRQKFLSSGNGDLKSVLYNIYGKDVYDNLITIEKDYGDTYITGVLAKPEVARSSRADEIYFVNKRYIKNKTIEKAIENAYEPYLMQHKFPLVVLDIGLSGKSIDVNVHPRKLEVRFSNEEKIYYEVYGIIKEILENTNLIHEEKISIDLGTSDNDTSISESEDTLFDLDNDKAISISKDIDDLPSFKDVIDNKSNSGIPLHNLFKKLDGVNKSVVQKFEEKPFITKTLTEDHKYIGQVFDTYILVEFDEKLYIIDQHAAHEKINFEKIMKEYENGQVASQKIFPSIILKLTPIEYDAVLKNIDEFEKVGFEIEAFGDSDIKVDAVPYNIFHIGSKDLLLDMIGSFVDDSNKEHYDTIVEKIASISCKSAIKANHRLSEIEVKELLRSLFKLDNPYNCPHGRPTIIALSKLEFEKRFGRVI